MELVGKIEGFELSEEQAAAEWSKIGSKEWVVVKDKLVLVSGGG
jgi:hypothetical protein